MIRTFKHKGLQSFFLHGESAKICQNHFRRLQLILAKLNTSTNIADLHFPGSDLHQLKGEKKEYWSIKVSANWRVIFRFENKDIYDVDYLDYH